jgi:23S rRNA pseudouridine1911/1915/1917 synthase
MTQAEQITFVVDRAGERLDKLLVVHVPRLTRSQLQALIKDGAVSVDGKPAKAGVKLRGGETVTVLIPPPPPAELMPEDIALTVLYQDPHLAVIDKPAGMVVHPGAGVSSGTLANAVLWHYPEVAVMKGQRRQGIVHRLDKYTSGVMVIARTEAALNALTAQFQRRTVEKLYVALLENEPNPPAGRIDAPIERDPSARVKMAVRKGGRPALTDYETVEVGFKGGQALVRARIYTGRTHQIRVHFAHLGCPVVGDTVYGYARQRVKLGRTFLHAARLGFDHPVTGERLTFEVALPAELLRCLNILRRPV